MINTHRDKYGDGGVRERERKERCDINKTNTQRERERERVRVRERDTSPDLITRTHTGERLQNSLTY